MNVLFFGCGQMGGAILEGVVQSKVIPLEELMVYDASSERLTQLEKQGVPVQGAPAEALDWAGLVILGIKPQVFQTVKSNLRKMMSSHGPKIIVSIMAGVTTAQLKEALGDQHTYIRTMPNLPLAIGEGATAVAHEGVPAEFVEKVDEIFKSVGTISHVAETQMDAVTAISGSGPAWAFEFIEGWVRGGVAAGLPRPQVEELVFQTLIGSVKYLQETGRGTSDLVASVSSPGGTTIAGVHQLEQANLKAAVMNAVLAAAERSKELSQS